MVKGLAIIAPLPETYFHEKIKPEENSTLFLMINRLILNTNFRKMIYSKKESLNNRKNKTEFKAQA